MAGGFLALVAPILCILGLVLKYPVLLTGQVTLTEFEVKNLLFQVISLGLIVNVGLFFLFLRKQKDHTSRGILLVTLILLIISVIHKYLL